MKNTMNRLLSVALVSLLLVAGSWQKSQAQDVTVSYQTFYDNLSPYGQWVQDPQYGDVWVPNEGGDFRPYGSRGHWVMTEYGNTWVTDDPWGWAVYHYGRWTYDSYYGWVWIPGYEWAPAWVSWRFGGGYSGWAPLGPGVSLTYSCPESWWIFVEPTYMYQSNCIHYWRGPRYNHTYIYRTSIVNNYYTDNSTHVRYNYGPRPDAIRQVTHRDVTVYHVSQTGRPGAPSVSGNNVSMYRPTVNRATVTSARPSNVVTAPRAIGAPQNHTNVTPGHQPAFRHEMQTKGAGNTGVVGPRSNQGAPQPGTRTQPQQQDQHRPQPVQRTEPQRQPQPVQRQEPQQRPQPQQRPEPQRQQPQPMQRPEPQRQQPQPMQRPQPQQRPEPQRQQPQPVQRQQPAPQQRPQPQAPQNQPGREMPQQHEGGRR